MSASRTRRGARARLCRLERSRSQTLGDGIGISSHGESRPPLCASPSSSSLLPSSSSTLPGHVVVEPSHDELHLRPVPKCCPPFEVSQGRAAEWTNRLPFYLTPPRGRRRRDDPSTPESRGPSLTPSLPPCRRLQVVSSLTVALEHLCRLVECNARPPLLASSRLLLSLRLRLPPAPRAARRKLPCA